MRTDRQSRRGRGVRPAVEGLETRCLLTGPSIHEVSGLNGGTGIAPGSIPLGIISVDGLYQYFTEFGADRLGNVGLSDQASDATTLPAGSKPLGIALGPDGYVYVAEFGRDGIVRLEGYLTNPVEYRAGITPGAEPAGIVEGPDGKMWFTEYSGDRIGRITEDGVVTEFSAGITPGAKPTAIAPGLDGNLWFTEYGGDRIGRITPQGVITEFSTGITSGSHPADLAIGADGDMWFTEPGTSSIGRITPQGVVTEFSAGITPNSAPLGITLGPDDNLWFTESAADQIGVITPAGVVSEYSTGITPGAHPAGIISGGGYDPGISSDVYPTRLWFTELKGDRIGEVEFSGGYPTHTDVFWEPSTDISGNSATLFVDVNYDYLTSFNKYNPFVGQVTLTVDGASLPPATLQEGEGFDWVYGYAEFTLPPLALGPHVVSALFTPSNTPSPSGRYGDAALSASWPERLDVVIPIPTKTMTDTSLTSTVGQPLSLGVQVSAARGSNAPPGIVWLFGITDPLDSSLFEWEAGLDASGAATFRLPPFPVGSYPFTVNFESTDYPVHLGSTVSGTLIVRPALATVGLTMSRSPSAIGQPVTLSARVRLSTPSEGTPPSFSGKITFRDGGTMLGIVSVAASGVATLVASGLGLGPHTITATYGGDPNVVAETGSPPEALTVIPYQAVVLLTSSDALITAGRPVSLSARVLVPVSPRMSPPVFSGVVIFRDGGTILGSVAVAASGVATLVASGLGLGPHTITATYRGDPNIVAGTGSSSVGLTVTPDGPRVTSVALAGAGKAPRWIEVAFDEPLDPSSARNPANYRIVGLSGRSISVRSVVYDRAANAVKLFPRPRLSLNTTYALTIVASGLTDTAGRHLDGASGGLPGSNFATTLSTHLWTNGVSSKKKYRFAPASHG